MTNPSSPTAEPITDAMIDPHEVALASLHWASNPALVEAANKLRDAGYNNAAGHLSNYMAGRFLDAYAAARACYTAMRSTAPQEPDDALIRDALETARQRAIVLFQSYMRPPFPRDEAGFVRVVDAFSSELADALRLPISRATRLQTKAPAELRDVLLEARGYVWSYGDQNAETGTQLQANIVLLLAKIDSLISREELT